MTQSSDWTLMSLGYIYNNFLILSVACQKHACRKKLTEFFAN